MEETKGIEFTNILIERDKKISTHQADPPQPRRALEQLLRHRGQVVVAEVDEPQPGFVPQQVSLQVPRAVVVEAKLLQQAEPPQAKAAGGGVGGGDGLEGVEAQVEGGLKARSTLHKYFALS